MPADDNTPMFFILVMDKYHDRPDLWTYSASAIKESELRALDCYCDPPHDLPKDTFVSVSQSRIRIRPCASGGVEDGTIHGIRHR